MARRTLTIKRIDPWSVLKVGFLANLVLLGILLLAGRVVWFFVERLELIGRACEVAESVGFQNCGLNGGNIFRNALLLGLLGVVVQTGILVFAAFLHNLIAELTGGLTLTVTDDSSVTTVAQPRNQGRTGARPGPAKGTGGTATPAARAAAGAGSAAAAGAAGPAAQPAARPSAESPATPGASTDGRPSPTPAAPRPGDTTQLGGKGELFGGARPASGGEGEHQRPRRSPGGPHGPSRP